MGDWASGLSCGLFGVVHVWSVLSCVRFAVTEGAPILRLSKGGRAEAFQVSACGGVCGFEAEDGQEDGTRVGGEPPAAGINQNFAYLDETRLPAPALR